MLSWILENIATIIICLILIFIVAAVIYGMIKAKKKGTSSCGCSCGGCPMHGACHKK